MKPLDLLRALIAPVIELTLLLPMVLFWATISLGVWALTRLGPGALIGGVLILILVLPPLFRFQTQIVESYAIGEVPDAMDAENFNWIGRMWTLFPLLFAIVISIVGLYATDAWGTAGTWFVVLAASVVFPATLAVLAITHSALQALSPVAIFRIYKGSHGLFLIAPAWTLLATMICIELAPLPVWAGIFIGLFMMFSIASLTGTLIAPFGLVDDVYIPENVLPDDESVLGNIEKHRAAVIGHAYGFISRDNRKGGFQHVFDEIEKDPDPIAAWDWYFNKMLGWENQAHALFFAQHYVHDALQHGEDVRALKAIMRCRMINEQFKPFPQDLPMALKAAETTGNTDLAEVLRRG